MGSRAHSLAVVLLSAVTFSSTAFCEHRTEGDASVVVAQWRRLERSPMEVPLGDKIGKVVPLKDSAGSVFAYAVYLKPAGFVVVSAEDEVEPVLAFSRGTEFKLAEDNPLGAMVLRDLAGRVNAAWREQKAAAGKRRTPPPHASAARAKWNLLRNRLPLLDSPTLLDQGPVLMGTGSISDVRVASFVMSRWNQLDEGTHCYNYYTPNYYYCGCVATAMAQLMRYYQKPTFGVGTASFSIKVDGVTTSRNLRGGNGVGGPYDWANMPLDPDGSTTETQRQAIGALCHDAGVASGMEYAAGGSGTSLNQALTALTTVFGYSSGMFGGYDAYPPPDISGALLNTMINPNLDAKIPVLLGILRNNTSGHAILCDGYGYNSGTLYHHLNLGWGGEQDAWYNLPTVDTAYYTYNSVFGAVYNVYLSGAGEIISGRLTNSSGTAITGAVVTATSGAETFFGTSDARGIYAIVNVPSSGTYTLTAARSGYAFSNLTADTGLSVNETPQCGNVWGKDFLGISAATPANPSGFAAGNIGMYSMDLRWNRNASNDDVLVAWKTNGTFGVPSGTYTPGSQIGGGGTVLYVGSATNFSHTGLVTSTIYSYRAWSFDAATNYSAGTSLSATTQAAVANPPTFASCDRGLSRIDLQWTRNTSNNSVVVAWKTNGTFGVPSGTYSPGSQIDGGGTVLYAGSATNFSHTGLVTSTVYDYRAWSFDTATNYSAGTSISARTFFIYYVNDSSTVGDVWCTAVGNAANSGMSSNAPRANVQSVLDTYDLEPGDSIHIDTGQYLLLSNIVVGAGDQGSSQFHVTLRGSPNGAILDRKCGTNGAYGVFLDHVSFIDMVDLSFTSGYYSVYMSYADTCVMSNLTVRGATNTGVHLSYSPANRFDNFRISGCGIKGLYAYHSDYNTFTHGVVWNNKGYGMELQYDVSTLVENCTLAFNTNGQIFILGAETVLLLTNTILFASGSGSLGIYWNTGSYVGDYNNLYATNGAVVGYCNFPRTTLAAWRTATAQDAHSLSADPMFVSASASDLHLQSRAGSWHGGAWTLDAANSPATDTGLPTSGYALEPAPNGGRIDMGAYGNTPQASKSADSDGDGLSDSYEEIRIGSNPASADTDNDGLNDGNELAAGTDPTNAASVFAITEVAQTEPTRAEVRWYSVANRLYAIDRATNLMAGGFAAVTNNVPATPPVNVYTDVVDGLGNTLFYRVKTQP